MFVHDSQLRHILPPDAYFSEEQHQQELQHLLMPGWHFVTTLADLRRDGDYVTLDLLDKPILIRRMEGEVHAYLNVCAHRHCKLTGKEKGHDPAFRCQYHGWEYQCDGRTGKIPDASSFRPFDRENARLVKYRTATCGDLVFVSLADEGPSLREHMGEVFDKVRGAFTSPFYQVWSWQTDYPANWKVCIENLLESYHIPCLHPKTFRNYPQEENITHEMQDNWTSFCTDEMDSWVKDGLRRTSRALGLPFTGTYTQWHVYPNLVFIVLDTFALAKMVVPTSRNTSRTIVRVYAPYGPRRGLIAWISARLNAFVARDGSRKILGEDASIFADAQRGLEASQAAGVIGRREERVYAFQEWIAQRCGARRVGSVSLPVVAATNGKGGH